MLHVGWLNICEAYWKCAEPLGQGGRAEQLDEVGLILRGGHRTHILVSHHYLGQECISVRMSMLKQKRR